MTCHLRRRLVATTILAALSAPAAAFAQSAVSTAAAAAVTAGAPPVVADQLEEVVVTAQHVTENLQKAAISATVSTGENLITRGIYDTAGLARLVPGLQITPNNGYTNYNIRGITSGGVNAFSDTAVAVNYNQVSLAFPSSASGMYYDLERVELLNGPQGILYGRNATAGAVNVITRRPDLGGYSGNVGLDVGNYKAINGRFALNVPVSEKVAMRFAGQTVNHGAYFSDGSSDQHDNAIRASIYAEPTDKLSLYLTADYAKTDNKGAGLTLTVPCTTTNSEVAGTAARAVPGGVSIRVPVCYAGPTRRTGLEDLQYLLPAERPRSSNESYFWGVTGTLEYQTDLGTLTVIPAYRRVSSHTWSNNAGFGSLIAFDDPEQTSIEARFQSPQDQRFRYQFGVYGLWAPTIGVGGSESPGNRTWSNNHYDQDTKSKAAFGQLTFALTDTIRLVGGLRYTKDTKTTKSTRYTLFNTYGINPNLPMTPAEAAALPKAPVNSAGVAINPANGTQAQAVVSPLETVTTSWDKATYKAGIEWDVAPNSFAYFDVRSGFKSGGYFFQTIVGSGSGIGHYDPETITAYSIGSKNRFFDNRLQVNLEAFLYDYKDQQQSTNVQLTSGQIIVITQNIGQARIKGAEVAVDWQALERTRLGFNVQWADGNYSSLVTLSPTGQTGNNATSPCKFTQIGGPPVTTGANLFSIDCSNLGFVGLSKWSYNIDASQTLPLSDGSAFVAEVNFRYQGRRNSSNTFLPGTQTPASSFVDANIRYRAASGKWDITAFANNIVNRQLVTPAALQLGNAPGNAAQVSFTTIGAPRTYGVRTNYYF